jgi:hypothetical protein
MSKDAEQSAEGTSDDGNVFYLKSLLVGLLGAFVVTTILPSCFTIFCVVVGIVVGLTVDPGAGLYAGFGLFLGGSFLGILVMLIADYEPSNKSDDS